MAKDEITKEKEKELIEKMEESRKVALANLNSNLWNYATPKLISSEQYGQFSKVAEAMYKETESKAPDQHSYEQLFLPQLQKEGGAITSPYLQQTSYQILKESFGSIKVEDAFKFVGAKGALKEDFKDKYVQMLRDKKGNESLTESLMVYKTTDILSGIVDGSKKSIVSELENILAEKPENKSGENKK
jgi:hypothetical protein